MMSHVLALASLPFYGLRMVGRVVFRRSLSTGKKVTPGTSTVDDAEVKKFTQVAEESWWHEKYKLLHTMNTLRVPLVRDGIRSVAGCTSEKAYPLEGYKIIDIGCGGGILSEPLARLGANVTGLDPGQENIDVAIRHASLDDEIKDKLNYICDTVENLAQKFPGHYDALVCSEVVEHVADVSTFVKACVELTRNGGSIFFTTINRTAVSYLMSILLGEYILRLIPLGTHDWNKFVQPKELSNVLQSLNCRIVSVDGIIYNPVIQKWSWTSNSANMYALHAIK